MFIYKWPADKENDTGIVGQHSSCDVRGECSAPPGPGTDPLALGGCWHFHSRRGAQAVVQTFGPCPAWDQLLPPRRSRRGSEGLAGTPRQDPGGARPAGPCPVLYPGTCAHTRCREVASETLGGTHVGPFVSL